MVGCDEEWNFDDAAGADVVAAPGPLVPGREGDDAGAPPACGGAAPNDPYDVTKWEHCLASLLARGSHSDLSVG